MTARLRFWSGAILLLALILVILVLPTDFKLAQAARPGPEVANGSQVPAGWGDGDNLEVGVEWIDDFPGTADDRSHWDESCDGLYYSLTGSGWTGRFRWTDWNAWKSDFVRAASGGEENSYVDNVDIAMLCTHGSGDTDPFWGQDLSSVYFGSSHPDQHLRPGDAYMSYGDKDLEWLAFDSCSVLSDGGPAPYYNRGYWSTTMNGLHLLLGFNNTMYVWAPGDGVYWSMFMKGFSWFMPSYSVTQAWFQAVDYNQPTITCARVLAETPDNYNDYLHGYGYVGADPAVDGTYWYWDHCSSGAKAVETQFDSGLDAKTLVAVPRFLVQQRMVNEDFVRQLISPAFFGDVYTGTIGEDDMFFYIGDYSGGITATLQIAKQSGGFNYRNLSELWVPPMTPLTLPSMDRSLVLISNWFSQTPAEGLPGVWYRTNPQYMVESLTEDIRQSPLGMETDANPQLETIPADVYVDFGRTVSGPVKTVNGTQLVDYQVVGPGSQTKVYLGEGDSPIGAQGGSRDVLISGEVELLPVATAWQMFLDDRNIAIPEVPYPADVITYTQVDFGYYELPLTLYQSELIPVYIFLADFFMEGSPVAQGVVVYVPAALEFMPPTVTITSPLTGERFTPGTLISFTGLAEGGMPPYTFEWKSDHDGLLGMGDTIMSSLSTSVKGGSLFKHIISLHVTDANGMQSTATIEVYINGLTLLPFTVK
jgi:hypothetical protein